MSYLIFTTQAAAIAADHQVALNFGMGDGHGDETTRYQTELQQVDGTWYLPTPPPVSFQLPPVYMPGPDIINPDGTHTPSGAWSYPTTTSDSLVGVAGYTLADFVTPMPVTPPPTLGA